MPCQDKKASTSTKEKCRPKKDDKNPFSKWMKEDVKELLSFPIPEPIPECCNSTCKYPPPPPPKKPREWKCCFPCGTEVTATCAELRKAKAKREQEERRKQLFAEFKLPQTFCECRPPEEKLKINIKFEDLDMSATNAESPRECGCGVDNPPPVTKGSCGGNKNQLAKCNQFITFKNCKCEKKP